MMTIMILIYIIIITFVMNIHPIITTTLKSLNQSHSDNQKLKSTITTTNENILNIENEINHLLNPLLNECRELIVIGERNCYVDYLDRFSDLSQQVINEDISSEFDRKVCCSMWKWFDCTRSYIQQKCNDSDVDLFEKSLLDSYIYSSYCKGYEYGSYYCWPLPLWLYILFGSLAFAMLTLGTVSFVWYWQHGFQPSKQFYHSSTHQQQQQRKRRRQLSMDFKE
ncbi:uncharacterized protein LOC113794139 [Dermatophagoides pteronyssinus]|uniref:uncharacterized protein LOC113794139 n=1 Tax=Dermatophagoides pteronyssinus TaxID=6956 RepID=UPI003F6640A4